MISSQLLRLSGHTFVQGKVRLVETPSSTTATEITHHPATLQDKRWVHSDGWCSLCNVPFTSWGEHVMPSHHIGHRMLEMLHDTMVRTELRTWSPRSMLYGTFKLLNKVGAKENPNDMKRFHSNFDCDNAAHKFRIHKSLMYLATNGAFDGLFVRNRYQGNASLIKGTLLTPTAVMKHLLVLFPGYDTGYLSEVIQLICSHDNNQDVFALIGGSQIIEGFTIGEKFWEADYIRAILGELHNLTIARSRTRAASSEIRALAQFAFHACIAELVLKVIEDMSGRVDAVWRRQYNAPFVNMTLPKTSPLNRTAHLPTITNASSRADLDALQGNRFKHESWRESGKNAQSVRSEQTQAPRSAPLQPHSYNTFRPRYSHFFKYDATQNEKSNGSNEDRPDLFL